PLPRPAPIEQIAHLRFALGDVRRKRQAELGADPVDRRGDAVGRVRRDAQEDAVVEMVGGAEPKLVELLQGVGGLGAEHLQIGDAAQPELIDRYCRSTAETAVPDRGDAGAQALGRPETCDRNVVLPPDPVLPFGMQPDPFREIGERIAKTGIDRIFEMGVRVDEAGDDCRVLEARTRTELGARPDRGYATVLDRHGSLLDRRALDRQDPVGGEHPVHGSVRLAGSPPGTRRSMSTDSQIDASKRISSGMASMIVVNGSTPGSATAIAATMK